MGFTSCCDTLKLLSRAAAKSAAARFRNIGIGSTALDWPARAEMCERCPLRRIHRGVSYCGSPFLRHVHREPHLDGCGCPTQAKAKSPQEHCPLDAHHEPAQIISGRCNCKWCTLSR
jgi:hypothetical protein